MAWVYVVLARGPRLGQEVAPRPHALSHRFQHSRQEAAMCHQGRACGLGGLLGVSSGWSWRGGSIQAGGIVTIDHIGPSALSTGVYD